MSRKWFIVFFSAFMPTGYWQATMDIVITLLYWGLHAGCLPYRTDWVDEDGNPSDPDLENHLQHYMYAIQIMMIVAMMAHSSYDEDPDAGGTVLLVIYFLGVVALGYAIARTKQRQYNRNNILQDKERLEASKLSTPIQMLKMIFDGMGKS
jgi:hypothetical protein